ncbi:MAG: hypothetical protein MJ137_06550 [Clostridia bacterium]|nr:hypothetical protein [Clostridia bacterium]
MKRSDKENGTHKDNRPEDSKKQDDGKRISSIYKKVLSEHPEIVYTSMKKRRKRMIIGCTRVFFSVIACFLILFIFRQAALPIIEKENGLTAEDIIKKYGEIFVFAVYAEADEWSREVAEKITAELGSVNRITAVAVSDTEYSDPSRKLLPGEKAPGQSIKGDKSNENGNCLAIRIGHTLLDPHSYLDDYHRLGGGYEIFHTDATTSEHETLTLLAFNRSAAITAADKFLDYFINASHFTKLFGKLYVSKPVDGTPGPVIMNTEDGTAPSVLVISRPAADSESLAAFEKLLDSTGPSLVIFNGGLSCGESGRQELDAAWERLSSSMEKRGIKWCGVFSSADRGALVAPAAVREVMVSYGGKDAVADGRNGWIVFTDSSEKPVGAVALFGLYDAPDTGFSYASVIDRAAMGEVPVTVVLPGAPEGIMTSVTGDIKDPMFRFGLYEQPEEYLPLKFTEAALAAYSAGFSCVIFAGNNNAGVFDTVYLGVYGKTAFCGNLDYTSYGLGGRYELNNSLRGGVLVVLRENTPMTYVRAAG